MSIGSSNNNTYRSTTTLCPFCAQKLDGKIIKDGNNVFLHRICPEHGKYRFLLSRNGNLYLELDQFYFTHIKTNKPSGRITNFWVFVSCECDQMCPYCSVEISNPFNQKMSLDEFKVILRMLKKAKCTFSGGEPLVHPEILTLIRLGNEHGIQMQLATNGLKLADFAFCEEIQQSGLQEVRLSIDSFDKKQAKRIGTESFYEQKLKALNNLETLQMTTILSPTIFKGINENQLISVCEYAKYRPFIRSISVNGFSYGSWIKAFKPENMIMPDEMMDILHKNYGKKPREEIMTFQMIIQTLLHLLNIRHCNYEQINFFVRDGKILIFLSDFLSINRMKLSLKFWSYFSKSNIWVQRILFFVTMISGISIRTIPLIRPILSLLFSNIMKINISKYPDTILPVTLNTNCSIVSSDMMISQQCMSGNFSIVNGKIQQGIGTFTLMKKEEQCAQKKKTPLIT